MNGVIMGPSQLEAKGSGLGVHPRMVKLEGEERKLLPWDRDG